MNIQSMTGYGRGVTENFKVEIRSSNHKNRDIRINIPSYLYYYEPEIRNMVKEKFQRGRIEIFVPKPEEENLKLKINKSLAKEYYRALVSLKDELSIREDIGINILASQRDIFSQEEPEIEIPTFHKALEIALEELKKMRIEEGTNLAEDITRRIAFLNRNIVVLEEKRIVFVENARTILADKLKKFLTNISIDETRLIQETAILVEKSDITEEIIRIKSHLKYTENILAGSDVIGKKLEFLVQELHRELNTISSKTADAEISKLVIEMKHELEKIREQIQNLQ